MVWVALEQKEIYQAEICLAKQQTELERQIQARPLLSLSLSLSLSLAKYRRAPSRCRVNSAHIKKSRPNSSLGFQIKGLEGPCLLAR